MNFTSKLHFWFAAALSLAAMSSCKDPFARKYAGEFDSAVDYFSESGFAAITDSMRLSHRPEFVYAVVAPEVIIYTRFKDQLETQLTALLYVNKGPQHGDFSVGRFQMKPSFVESIEHHVRRNSVLRERYSYILVPRTSPRDERAERLERMKRLSDDRWQICYLAVVTEIIRSRHPDVVFGSEREELRFYSTAYNSGFLNGGDYIRSRIGLELFPRFSQKKYNYASISVAVYDELTSSRPLREE